MRLAKHFSDARCGASIGSVDLPEYQNRRLAAKVETVSRVAADLEKRMVRMTSP
jgi:hypothetical protein